MGKVKKMESQNRVLKYICFPMETGHFFGKITKRYSISIVNYNVFRARSPTPQNPMKTNGFCTLWDSMCPGTSTQDLGSELS